MRIVNDTWSNPHPIDGLSQPEIFWGTGAPDANSTFTVKNVGSTYWRRVAVTATGAHFQKWIKVANGGTLDDFYLDTGVISERVTKAIMTDVTTTGTYTSALEVPIYATVTALSVMGVVAFSGDTTATLTVGNLAGDVDRYNTGTPSVFTTVASLVMGAISGTAYHAAAAAVSLVVTTTADFTATSALGAFTYKLTYRY